MAALILIVDDEPAVLRTLREVFETKDFQAAVAPSAAEALRALQDTRFDAVVTDMRMETDTSGFDVIRFAKAQSHKPVTVILSAFPIPATEWRAAGADAMFLKGCSIGRMLDDIEQLLSNRRRQQNSARSNQHERRENAG